MEAWLLETARRSKGFMPDDEGLALHDAASRALASRPGRPLMEIGSYCGKSAIYLASAARTHGSVLFTVDHHRGSEENQPGWPHHDPALVDPATGRMDTLPTFRRTIEAAGLEDVVVAVVGESTAVAAHWRAPLALLFVDGGHGAAVAWADYDAWSPRVAEGGFLVIHDVFADPRHGGRPPYELFCAAQASGCFREMPDAGCGSLRVLERVTPPAPAREATTAPRPP